MLTLALGLTLLANRQVQPPRLRTILPNGATILVEPSPTARTISFQLWASSKGVEERPETHGLRHLMEHILALGPNRDIDQRLELYGGYLGARTFRDATQIEVDVPTSKFDLGLEVISEMLKPIQVTPDQIATETKIIDQEFGLLTDDALLSVAAWNKAYGDTAIDPFGDLEVMRAATPADLEAVHKRQFGAQNLVLVIVGPVGLDDATGKARAVLVPLAKLDSYNAQERPEGHGGQTTADAYGEARAAPVSDYSSMKTIGALAAALAIASRLDDCYVTYTPSTQNGLVILGRTDSNQGLGTYVDSLDDSAISGLYAPGKALAAGWVERQLHSPSGIAYLRGFLLCQGIGARPETMLDSIRAMTYKDFVAGVASLQNAKAVQVGGTR